MSKLFGGQLTLPFLGHRFFWAGDILSILFQVYMTVDSGYSTWRGKLMEAEREGRGEGGFSNVCGHLVTSTPTDKLVLSFMSHLLFRKLFFFTLEFF